MSDVDKIRANAISCLRKANDESSDEIAKTWLDLADTWLGMLSEAQRTQEEAFEITVRNRGARQDASKTRH
jgi:hypothetical protein